MKRLLLLLIVPAFLAGCVTNRQRASADEPDDPLLAALLREMKVHNAVIAEAKQVVSWCEANPSGGTVVDSETNQVAYTAE
jgi:hypothetical protein